MTTLRTLIAATVIAAAANVTNAQDFTQLDISGMNANWNNTFNSAIDYAHGNIIETNMNDPPDIGMYQQQMQTDQFYGTLADFAYKYAATGGMSPYGYQRYHNVQVNEHNFNTAIMQDSYAHTQGYYPNVYGMYTDGSGYNVDDLGYELLNKW